MGFVKKNKVDNIRNSAKKAFDDGLTVFLARYWDEILNFQTTGAIAGASEAIEEVESQGWELKDIAYSWVEKKNRGVTIMVFKRKK